VRARLSAAYRRLDPTARREVWSAFVWSRVVVLLGALLGTAAFTPSPREEAGFGPIVHPFTSWHPLDGAFDFLISPFIRGDASWYVLIAHEGYVDAGRDIEGLVQGRPAFFPLYPLLMKALGGVGSYAFAALAGTLISLAALLAALYLLHRLTELELGPAAARATVRLVAFAPVAYFFSAPYTESLFLLLSVGSLYAARQDRWALAGLLAAAASGTRNVGALLIVPLAVMYLAQTGWRPRPRMLWIALAPVGLVAFSAYLKLEVDDWQAWRHAQVHFGRPETVNPFEGVRQGVAAAWDALEGSAPGDLQVPMLVAFAFLVFAGVALVGVFRNLPLAYGLYSLALVVPALCLPATDNPLYGFPRYTLVVFPLFMWLGLRCERSGLTDRVVFGLTCALALLTAAWASWQPIG
jgi:Mannosyltransferase (PIG-V)